MTRAELTRAVVDALLSVAPEAGTSAIDPKAPLRDQFDIDSMDFINFVIQLHQALNVDVPEAEYGKLTTLESCVDYLAQRLGLPASS